MNNKILKSLRHTMLSTVAAAIVSIGFTACSDEMTLTKNSSAPADGYKVCIPASIGGGETRAIAYNSETGGYDATFETTDAIIAHYRTDNFASNSREPLKPDVNGKSANLVGKLEFYSYNPDTQTETLVTPAVGDELHLFYKSTAYFDYSRDFSNQWDMETDYAEATVTITAINDGTITTSPATFRNCQSIFDVNFSGIASGVKIKKMMIASNLDKLVSSYNILDPYQQDRFGSVTYTYKNEGTDQHKLTFLLRFATNPNSQSSEPGDVITFKAVGSDGHVYSGTKSVSADLENGKYYHADVAMTDLGLAMTLTNNTTGELVELDSWNDISSKDAAYTLANTGFDKGFSWYGGENALTLKNVSLQNKGNAIYVESKESEDTRMHYLKLDGVNTLICSNGKYSPDAIAVYENSSLTISAVSTDGKLNISGMSINNNARMILESGDMTVTGFARMDGNSVLKIEGGLLTLDELWGSDNSSCIISKSGKVRIPKDGNVREGVIKAASGLVLQKADEGDYVVYTVKEAPAPKDLSTVTTADLGSTIGSDGKVYVPNCGLPEGVTPVGMIASISSTGHGLAVAMNRIELQIPDEWGEYYIYDGFSWDDSAGENNGKTATQIFDDWKANNSVSFGEWRFATAADWQQMVLSCRIDGDATEAGEEMVAEGLVAQLKQAGTYKDYLDCWTGEPNEEESGRWTSIDFNYGNWDEVNQSYYKLIISRWNDPGYTRNILPVLEF